MEKKWRLVCARTCLGGLSSKVSSLQLLVCLAALFTWCLKALGRFDGAVNSVSRVSALLEEWRRDSGEGGVNLGASAAQDISCLARLPRVGYLCVFTCSVL